MDIFLPVLNSTAFLMFIILIGFLLGKFNILPDGAVKVLSTLENWVLIPALVMGTFLTNFTIDNLGTYGAIFLFSAGLLILTTPLGYYLAKIFSPNDSYLHKIYAYGLCFPNFGFFGIALFKSLFPELTTAYLVFTLPLWTMIYVWATPVLLIPVESTEKTSFLAKLKPLLNPMFFSVLVGIALGLGTSALGISLPVFLSDSITTLGNTMSPVAMLLTGITISRLPLGKTFKTVKLYAVSLTRLILIPALFCGLAFLVNLFLPIPEEWIICIAVALSTPLGLSTITIPAAYGKDTTVASGLALISHLLCLPTIPVMIFLFRLIFGF